MPGMALTCCAAAKFWAKPRAVMSKPFGPCGAGAVLTDQAVVHFENQRGAERVGVLQRGGMALLRERRVIGCTDVAVVVRRSGEGVLDGVTCEEAVLIAELVVDAGIACVIGEADGGGTQIVVGEVVVVRERVVLLEREGHGIQPVDGMMLPGKAVRVRTPLTVWWIADHRWLMSWPEAVVVWEKLP